MLFNPIVKLAAAVCVATVAFASPAVDALSLQARQTLGPINDLGAKLEEYAAAAPKWDGTEAGIDALDGKLNEAAVLAGNVRELIANSGSQSLPQYASYFNGVIHKDYDAAGAAAAAVTAKALPAEREKIRDYYRSLMLALSYILQDAQQRNTLQYFEQANEDFVPTFTKYWNEMNSVD